MNSYFQLSIKHPNGKKPPLVLQFCHLEVRTVVGGIELRDKVTKQRVVLWDQEIQSVVRFGGGPTPLTSLMVVHLLKQKFLPSN